ncbi:hypothetical protein RQP54_04885 [Curvibacter sp. APW13]|uniref:hypothetical protein n=1 Tax=Curvibacter sp. APW13 TaxID=3077236 RepID=UPI0028E09629|nr:hypothetical protein [Curvibacter sp. APW13]MDT8990193.1 hypothetical protein [Curvibacter sp. APW13]
MSHFPAIEHHGVCASVSTERAPTGRWKAWVHLERGADFARLKGHESTAQRVPNDFPSEENAVLSAYAYVRQRIDQGLYNE